MNDILHELLADSGSESDWDNEELEHMSDSDDSDIGKLILFHQACQGTCNLVLVPYCQKCLSMTGTKRQQASTTTKKSP